MHYATCNLVFHTTNTMSGYVTFTSDLNSSHFIFKIQHIWKLPVFVELQFNYAPPGILTPLC